MTLKIPYILQNQIPVEVQQVKRKKSLKKKKVKR
jgi:hypothetical protein